MMLNDRISITKDICVGRRPRQQIGLGYCIPAFSTAHNSCFLENRDGPMTTTTLDSLSSFEEKAFNESPHHTQIAFESFRFKWSATDDNF